MVGAADRAFRSVRGFEETLGNPAQDLSGKQLGGGGKGWGGFERAAMGDDQRILLGGSSWAGLDQSRAGGAAAEAALGGRGFVETLGNPGLLANDATVEG